MRAAPIPEEKTRYSPLKLPLSRDNPTKILKARENDIREVAEHGGGLREELQQAATLEELRQVKQRWSTRQVPNPHRAALLHRLHRTGGYVEAIDFYRESASRHKDFAAAETPFMNYVDSLNKVGLHSEALVETELFLSRSSSREKTCEATRARLLCSSGEAFKKIGLAAEATLTEKLEESSLLRFAEALGGPRHKWQGGKEQALYQVSQSLFKILDGEAEVLDLAETLQKVSGTSFQSPLALASLRQTVAEYRKVAMDTAPDGEAKYAVEQTVRQSLAPGLPELRKRAFQMAGSRFSEAFHTNVDPRAGSEYVQHLLDHGHPKRAAQVAKVVLAGSLRQSQDDVRGHQARLEVALLTNDVETTADALPETLGRLRSQEEVNGLMENISRIKLRQASEGEESYLVDFAQPIIENSSRRDSVNEQYQRAGAALTNLMNTDGSRQTSHWQTGRLKNNTFHFRDINSRFVGGNISFGGAVLDITVNQTDIDLARRLLKGLGAGKAENFDQWHRLVDPFLQRQFSLQNESGNRPLEDLKSPDHHILDDFRQDLKRLAAVEDSGSSQTNLMVEVLMGRGDCRHVAYSKQLLYDVWKGDLQNRLLSDSVQAAEADKFELSNERLQQAMRLEQQQLVTAAMEIHAPIATHNGEKYAILKDDHGRPHPGTTKEVESHTLNLLLEFDQDQKLLPDGITAKDSFYKEAYPLGNAKLHDSPQGFRTSAGIMGVNNSLGENIPFFMTFSHYSGNAPKENAEECGLTLLGGLPVSVDELGQLHPAWENPSTCAVSS